MTGATLVGREAPLSDLAQGLRRVRERGPLLTVLTGPRGVGRSAVLDRLADQHDGVVLRATGLPWEVERHGGVVDQLLGVPDAAGATDPGAVADHLADHLADRLAAPDAVALVLVDDAQYADAVSLRALVSLVRHRPDATGLVVLATPSTPPPTAAPDAVELLAAVADRIVLDPLDIAAVVAVAAGRGVALTPWVAERLHRHTTGLPGAVVALLEQLPRATWDGPHPDLPAPAAVTARVQERLARLDPVARHLVEAASVLRHDDSLAAAVELGGLAAEDVWPAVAAAVAADLVRLSGPTGSRRVAPVDPMVAAAVLDGIGAPAAAALHRRAAEVVHEPTAALRHRVAAAPTPDADLAHELAQLAEERAAAGAWGDAAALLTDASRLTEDRLDRESRLTRAVDALVGAGEGRRAAALIPEIESLRETPLRNAVLAYLAILRGRGNEAASRLARAWDLVNPEREPDVAALICQRYVLHALSRCRWEELVGWADRAIDLVAPDHPAGTEAAAIRGLGLVACGRGEEAERAYARLTEQVPHGAQAQRIKLGSGWLHLARDEVDDARSELEAAVPTDHLGGSSRISLWARGWLARTQFLTGEWDDALRTVSESRGHLESSEIVLARPLLDWTAVQVHALRGDLDAARVALADAEAAPQDYAVMRVPTALARAAYAEARADHDGVVRALRPLTTASLAESVAEPGYWPWVGLFASALVADGHPDEADEVLRPHEERAAAQGHRSTIARLARARAGWHAAAGDLDAARASFEHSLDALNGLPLRLDRARTTFAYGQVLRRAGKRREADGLISAARDQYVALGATTYVARCDRELKAGGVHAVRADRGPADLTPQEEAVADLVASGLSNKEAAAELYLSTKTVQYHLTRIYAKLGIRSRTELAAGRNAASGVADRDDD
ncbi:LuxR C-terminal-related transcriptional regulator [Nocardioides panacisoli]|uniref:helix-turn-helix transcriptional regulator n=1 Tax=Nocardioides panacisoli TaxID=627624 RepID=UPI001C628806|nr:LuxR family transcriptional regulator [Nocardioides panacisoli]QYJ03070.1 LuxR C-terminal-related transcriptional regulator [Nocardioides panacisoli]